MKRVSFQDDWSKLEDLALIAIIFDWKPSNTNYLNVKC